MVDSRCPGQDMQNWKPGDIFDVKCPWCGYEIEFWKDEPARPCRSCGKEVRNPRIDLGCAKWCKSAKECLGVMLEAPDSAASVRERVIAAMRGTFGDDGRRIEHALRVLEFAERILVTETADPVVVKAAAVLHDIGIHEAERKHALRRRPVSGTGGAAYRAPPTGANRLGSILHRPRLPDRRFASQRQRHRYPRVPHHLGRRLAGEYP